MHSKITLAHKKRRSVLLLVPPAEEVTIRDGYCSYTAKADYCWPPIDLLIQSGHIGTDHDITVLDCNVRALNEPAAFQEILKLSFDTIFSLTGLVTWQSDMAFLNRVVDYFPGVDVFVSGELVLEDAERLLELHPFLRGALANYSSDDFARYLNGERGEFPQMAWRNEHGVVARSEFQHSRQVSYPVPRHDLFPLPDYRISIGRSPQFTTVVTSMGCNFKCPFCIEADWRLGLRELDNLFSELDTIKELGLEEVYFYDPNFTAKPKRVREICNRLIDGNYNFGWMANGQVACLDTETIAAMAAAGCHTVMMGLESGSNEVLKANKKGFKRNDAERVVATLKAHGIRVLAYFIFGLPGDSLTEMEKTIDYAIDLDLDFASFTIFTPLVGTPMWRQINPPDYLDPQQGYTIDRSNGAARNVDNAWTAEQLNALQRKAYRRFYLRPKYVLNRLRDFESVRHAVFGLREAAHLMIKQII